MIKQQFLLTALLILLLPALAHGALTDVSVQNISGPQIGEMTAYIDGGYDPAGFNRWRLKKGTTLWITSREDQSKESIRAEEDGAEVLCGNAGILEASGRYVIEITRTDSVKIRIPRAYPSLSQNLDLPQQPPFFFAKGKMDAKPGKDWVSLQGGEFWIRGFSSVEAVYPAIREFPKTLIAVAGNTSETLVITDLRTYLKFDANPFPFWRAARADLDQEEKNFKSIQIPDDRIGVEAYRSHQRETLKALSKIREGYQLLQRNLYSQKVIEKMLQEGVPIPRLTLTDITIVRGDMAYSIRPFVNWKGEGRVLVDRARLVTPASTPRNFPAADFQLEDLTNRMIEDTRLRIEADNSFVEVRRPIDPDWGLRQGIQFDLDATRYMIPEGEEYRFSDQVDATGFFIRKELNAKGKIRLSDLVVARNAIEYRFRPQSEDPNAATQFAKFMDLRRILFHPDAERRTTLLPKPLDDPALADFLNEGLDSLVSAMYAQGIKEVVGMHIRLENPSPGLWNFKSDVLGEGGKMAESSLSRTIPTARPISEVWERIHRNRAQKDWLDIEWTD